MVVVVVAVLVLVNESHQNRVVVLNVVEVAVLVLVNESRQNRVVVLNVVLLALAMLDLENKSQSHVFDLLHLAERNEDVVVHVQEEEYLVEENKGWSHVDDTLCTRN